MKRAPHFGVNPLKGHIVFYALNGHEYFSRLKSSSCAGRNFDILSKYLSAGA
jgi:hypothetical protein